MEDIIEEILMEDKTQPSPKKEEVSIEEEVRDLKKEAEELREQRRIEKLNDIEKAKVYKEKYSISEEEIFRKIRQMNINEELLSPIGAILMIAHEKENKSRGLL